jgi:hypothetical protein
MYSGGNFLRKLPGSLMLYMGYFGTEFAVNEQYLAYGYGDLFADFGGYLGLLSRGSEMFQHCTRLKSAARTVR